MIARGAKKSIAIIAINRTGDLVGALGGANQWDIVLERGGRRLTLSVQVEFRGLPFLRGAMRRSKRRQLF